MTSDVAELQQRTAGVSRAPGKQTQPVRMEVSPTIPPILFGVVLAIPGDDARYVDMGFVKPSDTYSEDGAMEFATRNGQIYTRPVWCEPNTTAGPYYGRYLWEGATDEWNGAIVVLRVYAVSGEHYAEQRGRRRFLAATDAAEPSDCYEQGSA